LITAAQNTDETDAVAEYQYNAMRTLYTCRTGRLYHQQQQNEINFCTKRRIANHVDFSYGTSLIKNEIKLCKFKVHMLSVYTANSRTQGDNIYTII